MDNEMPDFPKLTKNQEIESINISDAENGLTVSFSVCTRTKSKNQDMWEYKQFVFTDEDKALDFLKGLFKVRIDSKKK